jgi:hypothetical protein
MKKSTPFRILLLLALCAYVPTLFAQAIGSWALYPASGTATQATAATDAVYALTGNTLFSYHPDDESVMALTRLDGMSSTGVDHIAWSEAAKTLVIVYSNQDIDLLHEGRFVNIPELKEKVMTGSKAVNSVRIEGSKALLATDFGILVVDLARQEIASTYQIGMAVNIAFTFNNYVCAATSAGVYASSLAGNPYDKANWHNVIGLNAARIGVIGDNLYVFGGNTLFHYDPAWQLKATLGGYTDMVQGDDLLYFVSGTQVTVLNADRQQQQSIALPYAPTSLSVSKAGQLWATSAEGLYGMKQSGDAWSLIEERINIDSQPISSPFTMKFAHGRLYMITGGPFRTTLEDPGYLSILHDGTWSVYDHTSVPDLDDSRFRQLLDVAVSPDDPDHFAIGLFRPGMVEYREGKYYQRVNAADGYLSSSSSNPDDYVWASCVDFDDRGNLWVVNSYVDYQLRVMERTTGKWYKYKVDGLGAIGELHSFLITKHGRSEQKWFLSHRSALTVNVFEDGGTLDNTSDDRSVSINVLTDQDGNEYKYSDSWTFTIHSAAEDLDGQIWIGSSTGIFVFTSPHNVFTNGGVCTRPKVPRNDGTGLADYLLDGETVNVICVDAANRKWIGTEKNGVYLLSADGLETIHHFTTENSMLPSDEILSIAIDDSTGDVWIGTLGGLACYRSDAVSGADDYSEVYAYPNPVRPDYQGSIAVCGLKENTLVKVTDLNNNLIYQGTSLGGQFLWDGLNRRGERVKSGVYLVYGTSEDGKSGMVTKIMIIR